MVRENLAEVEHHFVALLTINTRKRDFAREGKAMSLTNLGPHANRYA